MKKNGTIYELCGQCGATRRADKFKVFNNQKLCERCYKIAAYKQSPSALW